MLAGKKSIAFQDFYDAWISLMKRLEEENG